MDHATVQGALKITFDLEIKRNLESTDKTRITVKNAGRAFL